MLLATVLTPIVSRLAKRYSLVDQPGPRKVHQEPVPRVGGIVFVLSIFALVLPAFFLDNNIGESLRHAKTQLFVVFCAAVFMYIVGLIDDLRPMSAAIKLICLVGASMTVCASGAGVHSISFGSSHELELGWAAWPFGVLWIVAVTAGINFLDGLDGLAAGITAIVCSAIAVLALWNDQAAMAVLMLAMLGAVTGFMFFNFHPAKIFMGDGGSMFLGFLLGAGSVVCQAKTSTLLGLAVVLLVLGVPMLDAFFTVIRRAVLERRSIFSAEWGHLHHRLLDLGLRHRTAVLVIYSITLTSASMGVLALTMGGPWSIILLAGGVFFLLLGFTWAGATRVRETGAAVRRDLGLVREARRQRHCYEDAQLAMRTADSVAAWWQVICTAAEDMQFRRVILMSGNGGHEGAADKLVWTKPGAPVKFDDTVRFDLPLRDGGAIGKIVGYVDSSDSLESVGRRAMLLARLVDEFPPPEQRTAGTPDAAEVARRRTENAQQRIPENLTQPGPESVSEAKELVDIMGVPVLALESYEQALERIEKGVESGRKSFWIAVNPQKCYRAWHESELLKVLRRADVCFCDGVGVSVAARILHGRTLRRCTGCDLFFKLMALAATKGWRVFLLGACEESNAAACERFQQMHPNLKIAGRQHGYFKNTQTVIEQINASKADLLFVGMGSPRQEYFLAQQRDAIDATFCMGVGGSLDVASGRLKRAPKIFRRTGTEFLFQLLTEPRKRWPRQRVYFPYMLRVLREKISVPSASEPGTARSRDA
jgi:exopolysaccharide biosynthesis WecB/TagA/CpsF family protein